MLDDNAYGLSRRRVTLSTSGVVPAIDRLAQEVPVALAVSLHASNDELRNSLIPYGEQQFPRAFYARTYLFLPDFQPDCWRKQRYNAAYCGSSAKKKKR
jgi:hypothetical protein